MPLTSERLMILSAAYRAFPAAWLDRAQRPTHSGESRRLIEFGNQYPELLGLKALD